MAEALSVVVPRETVNDDTVTIAKWHFTSGDKVRSGDALFEIETSKTSVVVQAERDGHLEILRQEGEDVPVGEVVCRLHDKPAVTVAPARAETAHIPAAESTGGQIVSHKARKLIEGRGLDIALFRHLPLVRESDVILFLEGRVQEREKATETASTPAAAPGGEKYGILHDARMAARARGRGLLWLGLNYFFRNYLLGLLVRVAPRGIILPLHRLRGVKMGRGCFIDPTAIVETAYPENICLGNDVRITARAVIMTHIKAPHYLRESGIIPVVLKEVVLDDHCFIGVNAVIMPGVRVGKAAVVASGAVVVGDVPPHTMVAGNPAKIVKRFPHPDQAKD